MTKSSSSTEYISIENLKETLRSLSYEGVYTDIPKIPSLDVDKLGSAQKQQRIRNQYINEQLDELSGLNTELATNEKRLQETQSDATKKRRLESAHKTKQSRNKTLINIANAFTLNTDSISEEVTKRRQVILTSMATNAVKNLGKPHKSTSGDNNPLSPEALLKIEKQMGGQLAELTIFFNLHAEAIDKTTTEKYQQFLEDISHAAISKASQLNTELTDIKEELKKTKDKGLRRKLIAKSKHITKRTSYYTQRALTYTTATTVGYNPFMGYLATDLHIGLPLGKLLGNMHLDRTTRLIKDLDKLNAALVKNNIVHHILPGLSWLQLLVNTLIHLKNGIAELKGASSARRNKKIKVLFGIITLAVAAGLFATFVGTPLALLLFSAAALPYIMATIIPVLATSFLYTSARCFQKYIDAKKNLASPDYWLKDRLARCKNIQRPIDNLIEKKNDITRNFRNADNKKDIDENYNTVTTYEKQIAANQKKQAGLVEELEVAKHQASIIFFGEKDKGEFSDQRINDLHALVCTQETATTLQDRDGKIKEIYGTFTTEQKNNCKKEYRLLRMMETAKKNQNKTKCVAHLLLGLGVAGIAITSIALLLFPAAATAATIGAGISAASIFCAASIGFTLLAKAQQQKQKRKKIENKMKAHLKHEHEQEHKHNLDQKIDEAILRFVFHIKPNEGIPAPLAKLSPTQMQAIKNDFFETYANLKQPGEKLTPQSYFIAREKVRNEFKRKLKTSFQKDIETSLSELATLLKNKNPSKDEKSFQNIITLLSKDKLTSKEQKELTTLKKEVAQDKLDEVKTHALLIRTVNIVMRTEKGIPLKQAIKRVAKEYSNTSEIKVELEKRADKAIKDTAKKKGLSLETFIAQHPAVRFNHTTFFSHLSKKMTVGDKQADLPKKKFG